MLQLPEELLFMILDDFFHEQIAPITRVSKRWRKVGLAHPNFSRRVRLTNTIKDKDIYITVAPSDAVPPVVADALTKNMHRAKLLHIRAYAHHVTAFNPALRCPAPILHSFEFLLKSELGEVSFTPTALPQEFLALHHPSLKALHLWTMPTVCVQPGQFDQIRKLHLFPGYGVPRIPSNTIAELFPSLQDLFLDCFGPNYIRDTLHNVLLTGSSLPLHTIFGAPPSLDLSPFDVALSRLEYLALHIAEPATVRAAVAHLDGPLELAIDDNASDQRCPTRWFVASVHKRQVRAFLESLETTDGIMDRAGQLFRHPQRAMPLVSDSALYSRLSRPVVYIDVWDLVPVCMLFPAVADIIVIVKFGCDLHSIKYPVRCLELRTLAVQGRQQSICVQAKYVTRFAKRFLHRQMTRRLKLQIHDSVLEGDCHEFYAHFYEVEYLEPRFPLFPDDDYILAHGLPAYDMPTTFEPYRNAQERVKSS